MLHPVIFFAEIYFFFLENVIYQTSKAFSAKFGPQWKGWKSSSQVKQSLALSCQLVALILGWNCIKGLRVTKIVKQIKFEGAWWWVKSKILLAETILAKISQTNCSFSVKKHALEKVQLYFWRIFCQYWQNLNFGSKIQPQPTIHEVLRSSWYFLIS